MNKTTAREIKVSCLGWLRFARQMPYVATEFQNGMHVADVFAANSELSVEIAERAYGSVMSTVRTAIDVAMIANDQHPKPSIETVEEMP